MENYAIRDITVDTDFKYQTMEWPVGGMVTLCERLFKVLR